MLLPRGGAFCNVRPMNDWTIDYIKHVLEARDWSANKLAMVAGLAASTIARPLREEGRLDYRLSRLTIQKIAKASGIDPAPFIPPGLVEEAGTYTPSTRAGRILADLDGDGQRPPASPPTRSRSPSWALSPRSWQPSTAPASPACAPSLTPSNQCWTSD